MRVLVTGHNGYLGSVAAPALRAAGHEVVGLDAYLFGSCSFGDDGHDPPAIALDIRDVGPEHLEGFDAVVHLAALANDPLGELDPERTDEINHRATVRLARLARDSGVRRFLFSSSCSIYGVSDEDALLDEEAPMRPVTRYAVSKVRAEEDLLALADDDFSPVAMRNATAYGVSPRLRVDVVLNNLVGWAHLTGAVRVLTDGTPWRPLAHVEDLASAMVAVLEADRSLVHAEAFNVGPVDENYRIRELAELVGETVSGCEVVISDTPSPDARSYRVDFSKLANRLPGYRPRWTARAGAEELRDAYVRHRLTERQFEETFTRLGWISRLRESSRLDESLRWSAEPPAPVTR